ASLVDEGRVRESTTLTRLRLSFSPLLSYVPSVPAQFAKIESRRGSFNLARFEEYVSITKANLRQHFDADESRFSIEHAPREMLQFYHARLSQSPWHHRIAVDSASADDFRLLDPFEADVRAHFLAQARSVYRVSVRSTA